MSDDRIFADVGAEHVGCTLNYCGIEYVLKSYYPAIDIYVGVSTEYGFILCHDISGDYVRERALLKLKPVAVTVTIKAKLSSDLQVTQTPVTPDRCPS